MRYFKFDQPKAVEEKATNQIDNLTEEEKTIYRQGKILNAISTFLFLTIGIIIFIGCCFMIVRIPTPQNPILFALVIVCMLILALVAFIVSFLVSAFIISPISSSVQKKMSIIWKNPILTETCLYLREYYKWQEPCIVTKCYDSSDLKFKNRDVCIYTVGDELRITANLKYGFSKRENDLGCYAFQLDEISIEQIQGEQFLMAELKVEDAVFLLGRRAKGFIEKNLKNKSGDKMKETEKLYKVYHRQYRNMEEMFDDFSDLDADVGLDNKRITVRCGLDTLEIKLLEFGGFYVYRNGKQEQGIWDEQDLYPYALEFVLEHK